MDTETKAVRDGAEARLDLDALALRWAAARGRGEAPYLRDLLTRFRDFVTERATQWDISKGPCNHHNPIWCEIAEALTAPSAAGGGAMGAVLEQAAAIADADALRSKEQIRKNDAYRHKLGAGFGGSANARCEAAQYAAERIARDIRRLADSLSQGSDMGGAGRDPKGSGHSRAEPSGALHDVIAEIVQRAGDDPAQHFLRRTIARRNEERAAALKQTAAEPASPAAQGGAGDRTVLPRGAADISASPAPRHGSGEAGETAGLDPKGNSAVGAAETPDHLTGFAPYTPVTIRSGTAASPLAAPQGADLAGLSAAAWDLLLACEADFSTDHLIGSEDGDHEPVGGGPDGPMHVRFGHMRRLRAELTRSGALVPTSVQPALAGGREEARAAREKALLAFARAVADGENVPAYGQYLAVANPAYTPDNGENPHLVVSAQSVARFILLALAQASAQTDTAALRGENGDTGTEWFWRIVDANGLGDVPSDEEAALRLLCRRAAAYQAGSQADAPPPAPAQQGE